MKKPLHLVAHFQNMKLKYKLLLIYLLVYVLAIVLLFCVLNTTVKRRLFTHEHSLLSSSLQQGATHLEMHINDITNLSNIIYNNEELLNACNKNYGTNYYYMYTTYIDSILPDFAIYDVLIPEVTDIKIYTSCDLAPYKNTIDNISVLKSMPWFNEAQNGSSQRWIISGNDTENELIYLRRLPQTSSLPYENYLYLKIDYDFFFSEMSSLTEEGYGLTIVDKDHSLLYQHQSFPESNAEIDTELLISHYDQTVDELSGQYLFLTTPVTSPTSSDWTVYYYIPITIINNTVNQTVFTIFLIIALCFTLLYMLTFLTVNSILSPLAQLTNVIEKISLEDIEHSELLIASERNDEIGTLISTFHAMLNRIHILINEAYVQKLKTKEYQFNALRAQINPHFLYNTLSSISARAIVAGQNDISETVRLLALFYRTSLNNGYDITTIANELDNIRAYISIQLTLTNHSFCVDYELDRTLMELCIPCLVLQPLVENAIEHGLKNSRKEDKHLQIRLYQSNDICYIKINDNGVGILEEQIQEYFTSETGHIGIRNVDERLKLYYGEENGLQLYSRPGIETEATIQIPIRA